MSLLLLFPFDNFVTEICYNHIQALMYPLLVACKSISNLRRAAAQEVVDKVRQHSGVLVDQVKVVYIIILSPFLAFNSVT